MKKLGLYKQSWCTRWSLLPQGRLLIPSLPVMSSCIICSFRKSYLSQEIDSGQHPASFDLLRELDDLHRFSFNSVCIIHPLVLIFIDIRSNSIALDAPCVSLLDSLRSAMSLTSVLIQRPYHIGVKGYAAGGVGASHLLR